MHVISYSGQNNFPFGTVESALNNYYPNINLDSPPYLDVVLVPVGGHMVLRFEADNPGIWLPHCHNIGHLLGGMGAIFLEALTEIQSLPASRK